MAIYDDSRTFIVDSAIESSVDQIKGIMKKASPYGEIFKLLGLLDEYSNVYSNLHMQMEADSFGNRRSRSTRLSRP